MTWSFISCPSALQKGSPCSITEHRVPDIESHGLHDRVVDKGQNLGGHHRRMCTRKTGQFHIWHRSNKMKDITCSSWEHSHGYQTRMKDGWSRCHGLLSLPSIGIFAHYKVIHNEVRQPGWAEVQSYSGLASATVISSMPSWLSPDWFTFLRASSKSVCKLIKFCAVLPASP